MLGRCAQCDGVSPAIVTRLLREMEKKVKGAILVVHCPDLPGCADPRLVFTRPLPHSGPHLSQDTPATDNPPTDHAVPPQGNGIPAVASEFPYGLTLLSLFGGADESQKPVLLAGSILDVCHYTRGAISHLLWKAVRSNKRGVSPGRVSCGSPPSMTVTPQPRESRPTRAPKNSCF